MRKRNVDSEERIALKSEFNKFNEIVKEEIQAFENNRWENFLKSRTGIQLAAPNSGKR